MDRLNVLSYSAAVLVAVAVSVVFAQQHSQTNGFNPGIRPVTAASAEAEKAAEAAWFAHVQVLASDDLNGRRTGTPDFLHAVEYVESQYKAIGLKPAGVEGYRQSVGFRSATVDAEHSSLTVLAPDGQAHPLRSGELREVRHSGPRVQVWWLPDSPEEKIFNDWIKNRYHHPSDDLNQPIDKGGAVHFGRVLLSLVTRVANAPQRPSWYPESFFSTVPRS